MGRPVTGRNTQNLSISLDKSLVEQIIELAKKEGRSKSNMAATLLREAVEKRAE